ncbi:MAG: L-ascorbate metabolism protein UlaG (beta-lactamase superfamily) [Granulosicoccus sp.]|jgi:L-ascorbate metabolism protein UlaG (beta-lactamase superfamily)
MPKTTKTRILINIIMTLLLLISLVAVAVAVFLYLAPTFGAKPSGESLSKIENSKQTRNGKFVNSVETVLSTRKPEDSMGLTTYIFPAKDKNPTTPLPSVKFEKDQFESGDFVWFGHSTVMFRSDKLTVMSDPVFNRASPIPIGGKPFAMQATPSIDQLPRIDVVIISHDHYDHLDHLAIRELASLVDLFLVPLGIQDHLLRWGVPATNIIELDWYETHTVADTIFTLTPARHFSGRGITNRNSTLWGSWVIQSSNTSVFFGGDSGYFDGFKTIGNLFGPFDIAFIENGAYDKQWSQIHMQPEEAVQAAMDIDAKMLFPIHWGKFDLAKHPWKEPIERVVQIAEEKNMPIAASVIGQIFQLDSIPLEAWWESE